MYEIGILYEIGKQRMQEFVVEAERKRMLKAQDTLLYGFPMENIRMNPPTDVKCC